MFIYLYILIKNNVLTAFTFQNKIDILNHVICKPFHFFNLIIFYEKIVSITNAYLLIYFNKKQCFYTSTLLDEINILKTF